MFGVSLPELIVVMIIVLLVFGPEKLPEVAIKLGKITGSMRRTTDSLRREFYQAVYKPADDFKSHIDKAARELTTISIEEEHLTCEEKERRAKEAEAKKSDDTTKSTTNT